MIDEAALGDLLVEGTITAGLDVFEEEPLGDARLLDLPNVVLSPHIGSATRRTREAMTRLLVDNLVAAAECQPLPTPVRVPA